MRLCVLNTEYYRCFGGDIQHSYLILEDLTVSKYENVDRLQGLNYDQLKISLKTIALWHAASVKTMNVSTERIASSAFFSLRNSILLTKIFVTEYPRIQ